MFSLLAHVSADPFHTHPHGAEASGSVWPYVLGAVVVIALLRVVSSRSRP